MCSRKMKSAVIPRYSLSRQCGKGTVGIDLNFFVNDGTSETLALLGDVVGKEV
jgi:hypothetical protein